MLIVGTGGLASDVLSAIQLEESFDELCFYNDTSAPPLKYISKNYRVITSLTEAGKYFSEVDKRFIAAVGDNTERKSITEKFESIGGENINFVSSRALLGKHVSVGEKGVIILHHAIIGNGGEVGNGSVIYCNASLGHCSIIKEYVLVSGNVCMSATEVGSFSFVGIGVNFKPGVIVGEHTYIGVGSVVTKDIFSGQVVVGNPAREIKHNVSN